MGLSFAALQASEKVPWEIDKLQSLDIGFAKTTALFRNKRPRSFSILIALEVYLNSFN